MRYFINRTSCYSFLRCVSTKTRFQDRRSFCSPTRHTSTYVHEPCIASQIFFPFALLFVTSHSRHSQTHTRTDGHTGQTDKHTLPKRLPQNVNVLYDVETDRKSTTGICHRISKFEGSFAHSFTKLVYFRWNGILVMHTVDNVTTGINDVIKLTFNQSLFHAIHFPY